MPVCERRRFLVLLDIYTNHQNSRTMGPVDRSFTSSAGQRAALQQEIAEDERAIARLLASAAEMGTRADRADHLERDGLTPPRGNPALGDAVAGEAAAEIGNASAVPAATEAPLPGKRAASPSEGPAAKQPRALAAATSADGADSATPPLPCTGTAGDDASSTGSSPASPEAHEDVTAPTVSPGGVQELMDGRRVGDGAEDAAEEPILSGRLAPHLRGEESLDAIECEHAADGREQDQENAPARGPEAERSQARDKEYGREADDADASADVAAEVSLPPMDLARRDAQRRCLSQRDADGAEDEPVENTAADAPEDKDTTASRSPVASPSPTR